MGMALGLLAGCAFRIRRAHVEAAMRRAGFTKVPTLARAMYASLGTSIFEFLWLVGRRAPPPGVLLLSGRAREVLTDHGRSSVSPARGLVVATAHTGNWDLVGCVLAREYIDLTVVTKRLSSPWLDCFWQEQRASFGVELVNGPGAFARGTDALGRGRAVGVMIDQAPERRSAVVELAFLGCSARCDTTAALLSARTGAPLVLVLGRRLPDGRHWIDVPLRLEPPARASRLWIEEATRALNLALERFILEHPSQWLWMHRRWKGAAELGLGEHRVESSSRVRPRAAAELAPPSPVC
jgi:Kdo2-lipid IVA lauroyltransferase/acyltransferase